MKFVGIFHAICAIGNYVTTRTYDQDAIARTCDYDITMSGTDSRNHVIFVLDKTCERGGRSRSHDFNF